jgi:hypothetical protein
MDNFAETQCSILEGSNLASNAMYASLSFLPTMRIKEWKPTNTEGLDSNMTYCYVDNDSNSGINDFLFSAKSCTDSIFNNGISFINKTFTNNQQDRNKSMPSQKCVLEIDPSKVNDSQLNNFWTAVQDDECDGLFAPIQASNIAMKKRITVLDHDIDKLNKLKVGYGTEIKRNIEIISANKSIIAKASDAFTEILEKVRLNNVFINNLIQTYEDKVAVCTDEKKTLTNQYNACTFSLSNTTAAYISDSNNYSKSNTQFEKDLTKYKSDLFALSNIIEQNKLLVERYDELITDCNATNAKLYKCGLDYESCTGILNTCTTNDRIAVDTDVKTLTYWTACKSNLTTCSQNLVVCTSNEVDLTKKVDTITKSYQVCSSNLESCLNTKYADHQSEVKLDTDDKQWIKTHYSCAEYPPQIAAKKTAIDVILSWCKFPMDMGNTLQIQNNAAATSQLNTLSGQVQACEAGADTLPTSALPSILAKTTSNAPLKSNMSLNPYPAFELPGGTYQKTCTNCVFDTDKKILSCDCSSLYPGINNSSTLNTSNCVKENEIENRNGFLSCEGSRIGRIYYGNTEVCAQVDGNYASYVAALACRNNMKAQVFRHNGTDSQKGTLESVDKPGYCFTSEGHWATGSPWYLTQSACTTSNPLEAQFTVKYNGPIVSPHNDEYTLMSMRDGHMTFDGPNSGYWKFWFGQMPVL